MCQGCIEGTIKNGKAWLITFDTQKPADVRLKQNYIAKQK